MGIEEFSQQSALEGCVSNLMQGGHGFWSHFDRVVQLLGQSGGKVSTVSIFRDVALAVNYYFPPAEMSSSRQRLDNDLRPLWEREMMTQVERRKNGWLLLPRSVAAYVIQINSEAAKPFTENSGRLMAEKATWGWLTSSFPDTDLPPDGDKVGAKMATIALPQSLLEMVCLLDSTGWTQQRDVWMLCLVKVMGFMARGNLSALDPTLILPMGRKILELNYAPIAPIQEEVKRNISLWSDARKWVHGIHTADESRYVM